MKKKHECDEKQEKTKLNVMAGKSKAFSSKKHKNKKVHWFVYFQDFPP